MAAEILLKRKTAALWAKKKKGTEKVYFSERLRANMREPIDVMLLSSSSCQQCAVHIHTHILSPTLVDYELCVAFEIRAEAKRDFPLEKVISFHGNHHRQPGQVYEHKKK